MDLFVKCFKYLIFLLNVSITVLIVSINESFRAARRRIVLEARSKLNNQYSHENEEGDNKKGQAQLKRQVGSKAEIYVAQRDNAEGRLATVFYQIHELQQLQYQQGEGAQNRRVRSRTQGSLVTVILKDQEDN